jgi:dTDP-L-rhamnose 4-epimerase
MKEKILITGGAGFIGFEIVKRLVEKNYEIIVYDNFLEKIHGKKIFSSEKYTFLKNNVKIIKSNLSDFKKLNAAMKNVNFVFHLASETGTGQSMYQINKYSKTNIMGTVNLIQAIMNNTSSIKKVILASSRSVYGEGSYACSNHCNLSDLIISRELTNLLNGNYDPICPFCKSMLYSVPTKEKSVVNPNSFYALTKRFQEMLFIYLKNSTKIDYLNLRFQNVVGSGQSLNNPYTGINNQEINIFEDGNETRDFIHVQDVAKICCESMENNKIINQELNVGTGIPTSVITLAKLLKARLNSKSLLNISNNFRIGDIRHNTADLSNFSLYFPNYNFKTMDFIVDDFLSWAKKQKNNVNFKYKKSLIELSKNGYLLNGKNN